MTVRKVASALTAAEQTRYINVIQQMIDNGSYGPFVAIHADMSHNMHNMNAVGTERFLPWHRAYLMHLEKHMQELDPDAFIPYWDWVAQRRVPPWIAGFKPTVDVPGFGNITVTRNPGSPGGLPLANEVHRILSGRTYHQFTSLLESGPHDQVHGWLNGTMSEIEIAPTDPIFWMHHAQVDRLWAIWELSNPGMHSTLSGSDLIMDPWTEQEPDLRDIHALGYSYG